METTPMTEMTSGVDDAEDANAAASRRAHGRL
jgi:hypothetical protein